MTLRAYLRTLAALSVMLALAVAAAVIELFEGAHAPAMAWIDDAAEAVDEWSRR